MARWGFDGNEKEQEQVPEWLACYPPGKRTAFSQAMSFVQNQESVPKWLQEKLTALQLADLRWKHSAVFEN